MRTIQSREFKRHGQSIVPFLYHYIAHGTVMIICVVVNRQVSIFMTISISIFNDITNNNKAICHTLPSQMLICILHENLSGTSFIVVVS